MTIHNSQNSRKTKVDFDQIFDLAIIGGGINGAAIARDAALRGMSVILLEKQDFGSGASSKTSKLAHGGLRYLEHFEFSLILESLKERALLLKQAPHLVRPIPFLLPCYSKDPRPSWQIALGLTLYDFLGKKALMPKHWTLKNEELLTILPGIKKEGLFKGFCFFDAQMNDTRLLIENVLAAGEAGAVVLNYAPVTELIFENGRLNGLYFSWGMGGQTQKIHAHQIVNATGAWCSQITRMDPSFPAQPLVSPTKGCHLVFRRWTDHALLLRAPQDGRVFFVLPWSEQGEEPLCLVGTTDTHFEDDPEKVLVEDVDRQYILEAVNYYFPSLHLTSEDIVSSFAGLRPLVCPSAASSVRTSPSSISRLHQIYSSPAGLISVFGGKYTSFRNAAQQVVDLIVEKQSKKFLPCQTHLLPFPASVCLDSVERSLTESGLSPRQVAHLIAHYGNRSKFILELIKQDHMLQLPLCPHHLSLKAELLYAIQKEHVKTADDWLFRRSSMGYAPCPTAECAEKIAALIKEHC